MGFIKFLLSGLLVLHCGIPVAMAQEEVPAENLQHTPDNPGDEGDPLLTEEAAESEPAATVTAISSETRDNLLLRQQLSYQAILLDDEQQLTALLQLSYRTPALGLVVILQSATSPAGMPPAMESLRRHLPASGWTTLAFAIPGATPTAPPPREFPLPEPASEAGENEDSSETSEENADDANQPGNAPRTEAEETEQSAGDPAETKDEAGTDDGAETSTTDADQQPAEMINEAVTVSREVQLAKRMSALVQWLQAQGDVTPVLLIESHYADEVLLEFNRYQQSLAGLILLNNSPADARAPAARDQFFKDHRLPILDVFSLPDDDRSRDIRKWQQASAQRQQHPAYRQLRLTPPAVSEVDEERHYWVERVRGFLTTMDKAETDNGTLAR